MADLNFFPDPNVDRVLGVVMELAGEVYVLRERLRMVETLLDEKGCISRADLADFERRQAAPAERSARLAERDAFIERILTPMTDVADSPAPEFEPA
jgi:hypothetical protein